MDMPELTNSNTLSDTEEESLYYLCGYCVQSLLKLGQLCKVCTDSMRVADSTHHPKSSYLRHKNFKDGALFEVSDEIYQEILKWENVIRQYEPQILKAKIAKVMIESCVKISSGCPVLTEVMSCHHPVLERLVKKFVNVRMHFLCKKATQALKSDTSIAFASPSMAMRDLASKVVLG